MTDTTKSVSKVAHFTGLEPGQYDLPEKLYHADPCPVPSASRSFLRTMFNQSPRHAWHEHPRLNPFIEPVNKRAFDKGSAMHKLVLGSNAELHVIDAANFRTKAAQEAKQFAYDNDLIPILATEYEEFEVMKEACFAQLQNHPEACEAFSIGKSEQTLIWEYGEEDPVYCRAMLDKLPPGGNVVHDYKTTGQSAHADDFIKSIFNLGYDLQSAYYSDGLTAICDMENIHFRFVVQEIKPPYAVNVIELAPAALELAHARIRHGLEQFQWCMKNNRWPGYPAEISYVDAPIWYERRFEDDKVRHEIAREQGEDLKDMMLDWQAPHKEATA